MITDLEWHVGVSTASWLYNDQRIEKRYRYPIQRALPLNDGSGVAIVEPYQEGSVNNAVVFNADGSERFRLTSRLPDHYKSFYTDIYYVEGILTVFALIGGTD